MKPILCHHAEDNRLYVDGVQVTVEDSDKRLDMQTIRELDAAGYIQAWNWNARVRRCVQCQTIYIGHWRSKYCSDVCRKPERNRAARDSMQKRAQGRARRRDAETCEQCGSPCQGQRAGRRYCSTACKQRAYRQRADSG
jgi:hypothetical protein